MVSKIIALKFWMCLAISTIPTASFAQTRLEILEAQNLLYRAGFDPGPIDGLWGNSTRTALLNFLEGIEAPFDGELSENELIELRNAPLMRIRNAIDYGNKLPENIRDVSISTMRLYFHRYLNEVAQRPQHMTWEIGAASNSPRQFAINPSESEYISEQMYETSMVSYLAYQDGAIVYDYTSPSSRFGDMFDDNTPLISNSIGKSIIGYLLGHAICEGYIDNIWQTAGDWDVLANTLYADVPLIDLLNMRAGDQRYLNNTQIINPITIVGENGEQFLMSEPVDRSLRSIMINELAGSQRASQLEHNYSNLPPQIVINYIEYRMGGDITPLLDQVFGEHVRLENNFLLARRYRTINTLSNPEDGQLTASSWVSRYDYLRIALAILQDWHSNTCIGQYLRDIYGNREFKEPSFLQQKVSDFLVTPIGYGGFLHTDFIGAEDQTIISMNGYGGQHITINLDARRIVVVNSIHNDMDWRRLVYNFVVNGEI